MKKIIVVFISVFWLMQGYAQDPKKLLKDAMELVKQGKYQESMPLFNQSIDIAPGDYYARYNRGLTELKMNYYMDALKDFDATLMLSAKYKKVYAARAETKRRLTDYEGALGDYTEAIKNEPSNADLYFERGNVNQLLYKKDSACKDFAKAVQLGKKDAKKKLDKCREEKYDGLPIHPILKLTKAADDETYGYSEKNPIRIGCGFDGGPANEEDYIKLLLDAKGWPIYFQRLGSCCTYDSPNGFDGKGVLDKYRIVYQPQKDKLKDKETIIYFTLYDYDEPKIIKGFTAVTPP